MVIITNANEVHSEWEREPRFNFATEVDALQTLEALADELDEARAKAARIMEYMKAAIIATRKVDEGHGKTRPQAIINHSRLGRQTVYDALRKAGLLPA